MRVEGAIHARARVRFRVRGRLERFLSDNPGIELGLTVFVPSRTCSQTNSAQALKETNRFTEQIPRIQAHTQGCHDATIMYRTMYLLILRAKVRVRVRVRVKVRVRVRVRVRVFHAATM